jgi:hypothetical protein
MIWRWRWSTKRYAYESVNIDVFFTAAARVQSDVGIASSLIDAGRKHRPSPLPRVEFTIFGIAPQRISTSSNATQAADLVVRPVNNLPPFLEWEYKLVSHIALLWRYLARIARRLVTASRSDHYVMETVR